MHKKKIIAIFSMFFIFAFFHNVDASEKLFYLGSLSLGDGKININVSSDDSLFQEDNSVETNYHYSIVDKHKNETASSTLWRLNDSLNPVGAPSSKIIFFKIDFNSQADELYIYRDAGRQDMVASFHLGILSLCGNDVCDRGERFDNCSIDCNTGDRDGYCDRVLDSVCDIDCLSSDPYMDKDCYYIDKIKNREEYDAYVKSQINIDKESHLIAEKNDGQGVDRNNQDNSNKGINNKIILFLFGGIFFVLLVIYMKKISNLYN